MNWNYNFHSDAKQSFLYYFLVYIAMHLHSLAIFVVNYVPTEWFCEVSGGDKHRPKHYTNMHFDGNATING